MNTLINITLVLFIIAMVVFSAYFTLYHQQKDDLEKVVLRVEALEKKIAELNK